MTIMSEGASQTPEEALNSTKEPTPEKTQIELDNQKIIELYNLSEDELKVLEARTEATLLIIKGIISLKRSDRAE